MPRRRRKGQGIGKKFMEYYPFIKEVIKYIIRKVFFICEQFINVTNNTNSCYKGLLKYLDAGAKVKVMEKFMEYYPLTKNESFFYLDNKKIYINSIL